VEHRRQSLCARHNFFANNAEWFFHEKRSTYCAIHTAPFLARFFPVVRVQIIQSDVHDVLICMHHAADPEFPLRGDKE
jgi:hypothetical protein